MRTRSAFRQLLIGVLLWLLATAAFAAPRIGVLTMQPGEIFFEHFGHNAIVVDDPAKGEPISYNFGFFDLDEPGFLRRFIHGDMQYKLVALPVMEDLVYYRDVGRGVSIQWLDITDAQARAIADALAFNALPENARYRYDYFTDNCSTRVRDALDRGLGGALRQQLEVRSAGNTFRSEAVRLASPAWWMWLGFDIGLGPFADRPLSHWEDGFVPMRLAASLREAKNSEGRPLVQAESELLPHRLPPEPTDAPRRVLAWLIAGLALAIALRWLSTARPRVFGAIALPGWSLLGVLGCVMAFIWIATTHRAGWANHNLLIFSPLCLLLVPGAWTLLRGRAVSGFHRGVRIAVAVGAIVALFLQLLPDAQFQAPWLALLVPVHLALAFPVRRT